MVKIYDSFVSWITNLISNLALLMNYNHPEKLDQELKL
jgi:hypothetical protein